MSEQTQVTKNTNVSWGDPAYAVRVTRLDYLGRTQHFEFDGYAVLRELFDDIETEAEKRGWFKDERDG